MNLEDSADEVEISDLKQKLSKAMEELENKDTEIKWLTEQNARLRHSLSIQDINNDLRKEIKKCLES